MRSYLESSAGAPFLPSDEQERIMAFRVLLLDQLLIELARELRTCGPWLEIPLAGLLEAVPASE